MSHADDGVLHALLDGELSAMEVARLESHLAGCEVCRARLEETRTLIARAGQLLARAVPPGPERTAPPLHQLRHPRLAWRLRAPLAWAATVVLALGIGWFASRGTFFASDRPATLAASDDRRGVATPAQDTVAPTTPTAVRMFVQAPPPAPIAQTGSTGTVALGEREAARRDAPAPAPPPVAKAATPQSLAVANIRPPPPAEEGRAAAEPPARQAARDVALAWPPITSDSARVLLGTELVVVPDLPIRRIRGSILGDGVVLVEQIVDTGANVVIRLYERREPAFTIDAAVVTRDSLADSAARAREEVDSRRRANQLPSRILGSLRIEIAGPLPADSLRKLLERVAPIR